MEMVERIKTAAAGQGVTLAQLEQALGFGARTIYKWDRNLPSVDKVLAVANFLQVSLSWLVTGTSENPLQPMAARFELLSDADKEKVEHFMEISLMHSGARATAHAAAAPDGHVLSQVPVQEPSHAAVAPDGHALSQVPVQEPSHAAAAPDGHVLSQVPVQEPSHASAAPDGHALSQVPVQEPLHAAAVPDGQVLSQVPVLGYVSSRPMTAGIHCLGYAQTGLAADYALVMDDGSMEPLFYPDDYIFLKNECFPADGDIVVANHDQRLLCRQFREISGRRFLRPFNPKAKEPAESAGPADPVVMTEIIGRVMLDRRQQDIVALFFAGKI